MANQGHCIVSISDKKFNCIGIGQKDNFSVHNGRALEISQSVYNSKVGVPAWLFAKKQFYGHLGMRS